VTDHNEAPVLDALAEYYRRGHTPFTRLATSMAGALTPGYGRFSVTSCSAATFWPPPAGRPVFFRAGYPAAQRLMADAVGADQGVARPTEFPGGDRVDLLRVGHIGSQSRRGAASGSNACGDLLDLLSGPRHQYDRDAVGGQRLGRSPPGRAWLVWLVFLYLNGVAAGNRIVAGVVVAVHLGWIGLFEDWVGAEESA
jgi:hypothetical protein